MARKPGDRNVSPARRLEIRRRVATGEPIDSVASGVGRTKRTVHNVIARAGSIPPRDSIR